MVKLGVVCLSQKFYDTWNVPLTSPSKHGGRNVPVRRGIYLVVRGQSGRMDSLPQPPSSPEDWTQVLKLGRRLPRALCHLTGPHELFLTPPLPIQPDRITYLLKSCPVPHSPWPFPHGATSGVQTFQHAVNSNDQGAMLPPQRPWHQGLLSFWTGSSAVRV